MSQGVVSRSLLKVILLLGVVQAAGCGHGWTVIRDGGAPSPLRGAGPITVSFDYSKLLIGGQNENDWVQSKLVADPLYPKVWSDLKTSFETNLVSGLAASWPPGAQPGPPGPGVHMFVMPTSMSMGKYMFVAATATSVNTTLGFTVNGQQADEIGVVAAQQATAFTPSVHQHIPGVASYIGKMAGRFVASKN